MKIWYQLVSSPRRSSNFLAALQKHCDTVAAPTTEVLVRGTPQGGFADQYAALLHLDGAEILRLAREQAVADEPADVYAMANCLDPGLHGLRELLDVPVLTLMGVGCFLASLSGDRFGVIAPNPKMIPMIRDIVAGYGYGQQLAGLLPLEFGRITDMDGLFVDATQATATVDAISEQGRALIARGAEVILTPGPIALAVAQQGLTEIDGAPVIDLYGALVKMAEAVGSLAASGFCVSRVGRYQRPSPEQIEEAFGTIWPQR